MFLSCREVVPPDTPSRGHGGGGLSLFHSSSVPRPVNCFNSRHSDGPADLCHRGLNVRFPDGLWGCSVFIWWEAIWLSYLVKWVLQSPHHLSSRVPEFSSCWILDESLLWVLCVANNLSHSGFTFPWMGFLLLFYEWMFLNLMQWNSQIISLIKTRRRQSPLFSSRSFITLSFISRSTIHLELIFGYSVR